MKSLLNILWFAVFFILVSGALFSQETGGKTLYEEVHQKDPYALKALAIYPDEIAQAAAELATNPSALVFTQSMQVKTQDDFQSLLIPYNMEEQKRIYWVISIPGLLEALLEGGPKSKSELKALAREFPEAFEKAIVKTGKDNFDLLQAIQEQLQRDQGAFETLCASYPESVQKALHFLLDYPEVLNLMAENTSATLILGELYKKDPALLGDLRLKTMQKLQKVFVQELVSWRQAYAEDEVASKELIKAAKAFCKNYNLEIKPIKKTWFYQMTEGFSYSELPSFPYWTGYPWWYSYPYWKINPYFYHTGFYLDSDKEVNIFSTPSYPFIHWIFENGETYPNTLAFYKRFFQEHKRSGSTFSLVMASFESGEEGAFPEAAAPEDNLGMGEIPAPPLPEAFRVFKAVDYHWAVWDYRLRGTDTP